MLHFSREYSLHEPTKDFPTHRVRCSFLHASEPSDVNLDYGPVGFEGGKPAASFEAAYYPSLNAIAIPTPEVENDALLGREEVLAHLQIEALKHFRNKLGGGLRIATTRRSFVPVNDYITAFVKRTGIRLNPQ